MHCGRSERESVWAREIPANINARTSGGYDTKHSAQSLRGKIDLFSPLSNIAK